MTVSLQDDGGTANGGADTSDPQTFTITVTAVNDAPVISDIPDQTIPEGATFTTINLDNYVSDIDNPDSEITWTYSGNNELSVTFDSNRIATIGIPNPDWNGDETILFTAADPDSASDSDSATFTVTAVNDAPVVGDIPNQTILEGATFTAINLDDYVSDVDDTDDQISWTASENIELSVTIDSNRVATIGIPNSDWNGSETITFTATDPGSLSDSDQATFTVTPAPEVDDAVASSEVYVAGTVSGDYTFTHLDDGKSEVITERDSGGKPQNRYSYLEHKWIFNATPGNLVTLYADVWSSGSSEGDSFIFAYSTNDASYTEMFTVNNTSSDGNVASYSLPASIQGTVYVRVTDSDHTPGNRAQDSVYVDHLYIRSETSPGDPPAAPSDLNAVAASASQIDLTWSDNSTDEYGFQIERSMDGVDWSQIDTVGADATNYSDPALFPNTTYYYQVRAYNASGLSGYSNMASATTAEGLSLTANGYKVKGMQKVDLTWSDGSATSFDVYRDGNPIAQGVPGNAYTDNINEKGGGSYQYQVCEAGSQTNCSNTVQVDF